MPMPPPGQRPLPGLQQLRGASQPSSPYTSNPVQQLPGTETGTGRGTMGQPTPWWQLNPVAASNQLNSAPPGYSFDLAQRKYVPITQSAPYQQELEAHRRQREDTVNKQLDEGLARGRFQEDEQTRRSQMAFQNLQSLYGSMSGSSGGGPSFNYSPSSYTTPNVSLPAPTQFSGAGAGGGNISGTATAAQNAAFGRAKATAGSLGASAMEGLRAQLADRGILGSGVEARGLVDQLAAATNPLSDLNVAGLKENVDIAQQNQKLAQEGNIAAYQGGITQRGQDIGSLQENAQRQFQGQQSDAQRQFEVWRTNQELNNQRRLAAINGLQRMY